MINTLVLSSIIVFGATSGRPTVAETASALEALKAAGINEYMVYPRSGLEYEYMGDDWLDYVYGVVDAAEKLEMGVWLYDEFNWPSGSCKGRVPMENTEWAYSEYEVERLEDGSFAWRVERDFDFGANNYSLEAMNRFRELTHEKYEKRLKRHFGKTVRGIMTDEPAHYSLARRREVAARRKAAGRMVDHFRWWRECEADYREATGGRDFRRDAEAWYRGDGDDSVWKVYTENLARRFVEAHFATTRRWCERNGLEFTGHMIAEQNPPVSAENNGLPVEVLASLSVPGMDEIYSVADGRMEWLTFHLMEQAARKNGKGGLAELFAMGPCDMTWERMRRMIMLAAAHGADRYLVSLHQLNALGYTDPTKNWAMFVSPTQPWFENFRLFAEEADRLAMFARKTPRYDVAVRYPERDFAVAARCKSTGRACDAPGLGALLRDLETSGFATLLLGEDETTALPVVSSLDEARRLAVPSGKAGFVTRRYEDGTALEISVAGEGSTPQGKPVEAQWEVSADRPVLSRVRFSREGVASVSLARPEKVRFALRSAQANRVGLMLDGRPLPAASSRCDSLPFAYAQLYGESAEVSLAAGMHELRLVEGRDDCFFLPAAWMVREFSRDLVDDFAGRLTYRVTVDVPADAESLRLDTGDAVSRVTLGGRDLGLRGWRPFVWEIPAEIRGRTAALRVDVWTSVRPAFGRDLDDGVCHVAKTNESFPAAGLKGAWWIAGQMSGGEEKVSPDGRNRIEYRDGSITVSRDGKTLFGPQPISLSLDRGEAGVELVARDDGVAYRFVSDIDGEVTVNDETCALVFPCADTEIWTGYNWRDNPKDPKQDKLQHGCASIYTKTTPGEFAPDGRRIAYLPLTVRFDDGTTVLFSEADLRDYAGLHLRRSGSETRRLDAVFGKYPVREKEWTAPRNYRRVRDRESWIVKTSGRRTFPWRVFAIAPTPAALMEQRLVYDLATSAQGDYSWVKPGPCAWDWWSKWHLEGVPFSPGVNTETYRHYADFAAEFALPWMLVDEGWNSGDDLYAETPGYDLDAVLSHAAARNVRVMLWTPWRSIDGRQEEYFSHFAKRGVKGFKIDFIERDDAEVVRFMEETLKVASRHRLCIDFHGCGKPTGLERTYPNLVGVEGVHGLELMKLAFAKDDDFPAHDCQVAFTRAPLGMVDYTPGAMMNRTRGEWLPDDSNPASQGTRVHQMALYTMFPVPLQMLCDSPSRYRRNSDCTRFIASVPTVWDETKGLAGEIGKYAAVARRKGDEWWVGAITDWSSRALSIDTFFLGAGEWKVEIFSDAEDSASVPERWTKCSRRLRAGEKIQVDLAPGGGWTARFSPVSRQGVFLEAEAFSDKGGWTVDCQHALQMGSPYLLAHGLGNPVANARTSFASECGGSRRLWVRTRNWTADWSRHPAGLFRVRLNGSDVGGLFGEAPAEWSWVGGAECELQEGTNVLELVDETGFDGRVDAIAFTYGDETPELLAESFRRGVADREETVSSDLVVVGGGMAGTCAALAAARSGLKVALVQDRPVLGGNNSSEVRVHMGGHMQCGEYPHLGDIVAEISPEEGENARGPEVYEDDRKLRIVKAEPNIALFLDTKADGVEMASNRIAAVRCFDVASSRRLRFEAPLFVDSTGDGTLGFLAGADYRSGRESKAETGEPSAPKKADSLTMGASCQWRAVKAGGESGFPLKPWMLEFDDKSATFSLKGDWDWEVGLGRDQIAEAERIRDYGMLVAYSNWGFVKNKSSRRGEFAGAKLDWVASVAGRRESRRLLGDVVLDETDIMTARPYPDATCLTSWSIDLHYPKQEDNAHFAGESFRTRCEQRRIALYPIPLGCLYSRNVGNLFIAGRNISVTHIALGTVRVMRTTGMMGEVVGLAAAVCKEKGCLPRDVRLVHFGELARRMKRGAGAGNAWSRQEYNAHPSLGLDIHDEASVARSKARDWSNVDLFRGLTVDEPGVLSNKLVWVSAANGVCSAFRCGESRPFAKWSIETGALDMRVRLDEAHPFVYVDVAPRAASTNILAGVLSAPEIWAGGLGTNMVAMGSAGLGPVDMADPSCGYLAVAEPFMRRGIVAGWLTNFKASGAFSARKDSSTGAIGIVPIADYGRMRVKAGTQPQFDTFVVGAFDDCRLGLEAYADAVADRFAIRLPPNKTGYCSWSSDKYGASDRSRFASGCGCGTEESMLEFAAAAEKLVPYGFEFVQVDDQWQDGTVNNGPAKDWSRTSPSGGYPNGFGIFIDGLRRHGLTAGLWFIPFGGDAASEAWKGCEALYVKSAVDIPKKIGEDAFSEPVALPRRRGDPIKTVWGGECLDMTNPASQERLADTVRRFTSEWGFRYLKCDGIFTGLGCDIYGGYDWKDVGFAKAVFSDPDASNASAYRLGLETIRKASAPGTFVLGCNLGTIRAMVPSFGLVDGMRAGNDNGPIGLNPMRYLEGPQAGTMRYFFNGRVWRSHPDSTFVRAALPAGRARLGASWTAISDSVFELGDWLPSLPEERVEILRRTMAHHGFIEARPIDYFENAMPNAWILDSGEKKVVALFNWSTNEVLSVDYDFSYAGLDPARTYVGYDFWGRRPMGPMRSRLSLSVPPDDCLVFSCCEASEREQVVSTSLHVASPVYGVAEGRVLTIAGEPLEVRTYSAKHGFRTFVVPAGSGGWIEFRHKGEDGNEL